jgi:chromosomal replication initiator protein
VATRIEAIKQAVADYFEVKPRDLLNKSRNPWFARPRMIGMYFARKLVESASYKMIGQWFGGRDHSTVIKDIRKIEQLYAKEGPTRRAVTAIESRLGDLA